MPQISPEGDGRPWLPLVAGVLAGALSGGVTSGHASAGIAWLVFAVVSIVIGVEVDWLIGRRSRAAYHQLRRRVAQAGYGLLPADPTKEPAAQFVGFLSGAPHLHPDDKRLASYALSSFHCNILLLALTDTALVLWLPATNEVGDVIPLQWLGGRLPTAGTIDPAAPMLGRSGSQQRATILRFVYSHPELLRDVHTEFLGFRNSEHGFHLGTRALPAWSTGSWQSSILSRLSSLRQDPTPPRTVHDLLLRIETEELADEHACNPLSPAGLRRFMAQLGSVHPSSK